ncbi:MAG: carboxypeptidase regulatory-like domain-containing protein [Armatimonadota bacterium]
MTTCNSRWLISVILAAGLLFALGTPAAHAQGTPPVLGDLNGSGKIDVPDAVLALRMSIGIQTPSAFEVALGDISPLNPDGTLGDGQLKLNDAIYLLRIAAGLEPGLPVVSTGNLAGRVTDSSVVGAVVPIAGATVIYTSTENQTPLGTTISDSRGWYILRNVPPGQYRLAALAEKYNPIDTIKPVAVAANTVVRVELPMEPSFGDSHTDLYSGVITGRIVDSSTPGFVKPVVGALVGYRTADNPTPTATAVTNNEGLYRFVNVQPGAYHVVVVAEGYNQQMTQKTITVIAQKTTRQDFVMEPAHGAGGGSFLTATLTARVVDRSVPGVTTPIAGATVAYRSTEDPKPIATTSTDQDGWFFFGNVPPGVYHIAIIADGYMQATSQQITALPGNSWPTATDGGRLLTLAKAPGAGGGTFDTFSLTGRVSDQSVPGITIPIANATVAYRDPVTQQVLGSATTDSAGYYWFGKLTPGTYQITAAADGYYQTTSKPQTFPPGITAVIDIPLQPAHGPGGGSLDTGTIAGRVLDQTVTGAAAPAQGATVGYRTADNPTPIATATVDSEGWFFFGNVKPGQYLLAVIAEKYNQATTKSFTLLPGSTYLVDIGVSPIAGSTGTATFTTATITGRVLDTSVQGAQTPLAGATVAYRRSDELNPIATATTDANGWYRFTGVQPGTYRLDAIAEGYSVGTVTRLTVPVGTTSYQDIAVKK